MHVIDERVNPPAFMLHFFGFFIGCFMSELERLDASFYLCCCCHDYSRACRIGSCLLQSDLTFQCRSVLQRWPTCLLLLKAHRFGCEGRRRNKLFGQESKPKCRLMFYQLLWRKMKAKAGLIFCFSLKSCSSSDPLFVPFNKVPEAVSVCVDVSTDADAFFWADASTGFD